MENDIRELPICELLFFHSTTKENLKGIMIDGIKPGMKGGLCDLWIKMLEKETPSLSKEELEVQKKDIEEYKKECKDVIFLSPDFHELESEMPIGSETIIILCLPKKMVYIPSVKLHRYVPFEEWEELDIDEEYKQVIVKETISPHYIVGYLHVENPEKRETGAPLGITKFRIDK